MICERCGCKLLKWGPEDPIVLHGYGKAHGNEALCIAALRARNEKLERVNKIQSSIIEFQKRLLVAYRIGSNKKAIEVIDLLREAEQALAACEEEKP
jgi:hypothetical protein